MAELVIGKVLENLNRTIGGQMGISQRDNMEYNFSISSVPLKAMSLDKRKRIPMSTIREIVSAIARNFDPDQIILVGFMSSKHPHIFPLPREILKTHRVECIFFTVRYPGISISVELAESAMVAITFTRNLVRNLLEIG